MKIVPITKRLQGLVAVSTTLLIVFGAMAYLSRERVQIGSPAYLNIVRNKDLTADVMPPPAYIIEAYLLTWEVANASDAGARVRMLEEIARAESNFRARQKFWDGELPDSRMKDALVRDAAKHADVFFKIVREQFAPAINRGDMEGAQRLVTGALTESYRSHRTFVDEVVGFATQAAEQQEKETSRIVQQAKIREIAAGAAIAAIGIGLGGWLTRSITLVMARTAAALNDASSEVAAAAAQVSMSSQALAAGSSEQAASLEESSASLEETSSMAAQNAEGAEKANDLARKARELADAGGRDMQAMTLAIEEIRQSGDEISKIIRTIDEIAFQTNILVSCNTSYFVLSAAMTKPVLGHGQSIQSHADTEGTRGADGVNSQWKVDGGKVRARAGAAAVRRRKVR